MREYSHDETSAEFAADFSLFWRVGARFRALAHAAGALMPAALAKSVCAPSTGSTAQTSPAVGWCSWPDPGNVPCDDRTGT